MLKMVIIGVIFVDSNFDVPLELKSENVDIWRPMHHESVGGSIHRYTWGFRNEKKGVLYDSFLYICCDFFSDFNFLLDFICAAKK